MEWIPTSVRMPSEQGQYLVTFPLCNGEPWVYILSFNKGKFYETDDEWGDVEYDDVTAWMPLPKPYTADTPQTESTGSPIGDYRDGVGAWQMDCDDRYAVRTDSGEVVAYACPLGCEQTDCQWK